MKEVKVRKAEENLTRAQRYEIVHDYIYSNLSNEDIAKKYCTSSSNVNTIVSRHYKALCQVRETKNLITTQKIDNFKYSGVLDTEKINEEFLQLLSEPDSVTLSDNEMMFCELYNDNGDEIRALEEAGLNVGLSKRERDRDRDQYEQSLRLRAFYLRRKPNVGTYLNKLKSAKIQKIINGKEFIQNELLEVVERLKNTSNERSLSTYLKAVEALGRTWGVFDDKLTVETLSGDSALDKILEKARASKSSDEHEETIN